LRRLFAALIVAAGLLLLPAVPGPAAAESAVGSWTVPARTIPLPATTSPQFLKKLRQLPAPNLAAAEKMVPTGRAAWLKLIEARNRRTTKTALELAKQYGIVIRSGTIGGVPVRYLYPKEISNRNRNRIFLHLHGGAYVFNGGMAGIYEAVLIADRARIQVLSVDYRMPPEDPFPAALKDVVKVYRTLIRKEFPGRIAIGGTSAGGGLTLAAVLKFKELGLSLPGALFLGTPWSDLSKTGDSLYTNAGIDHILVSYDGLLEAAARLYAGGHDLKEPLLSPVYGDFKDFPPAFLVSGTRDLLLSHTVRVHRKLRQAGVVAELNVIEGFSHADYIFAFAAPESQTIYRELGGFLDRYLR
jgi:acetyl esterase/lipase